MFKILKFGGSSVKNADCIKKIVKIINSQKTDKFSIAIVVSAFEGITDKLISILEYLHNTNQFFKLVNEIKNHHILISRELGIQFSKNCRAIHPKTIHRDVRGIFLRAVSDFPLQP